MSGTCLLFMLMLVVSMPGCNQEAAATQPVSSRNKTRQYIVLIDVSASRTSQMREEAKTFVMNDLLPKLSFGDELVLMQIHEHGVGEKSKRFKVNMPLVINDSIATQTDLDKLSRSRDAVKPIADKYLHGKTGNTDILSTLHVASEYARQSLGRSTVLVLLSDMLQSSGGIEMQRRAHMPNLKWIDEQKKNGLVPDLSNACVLVVGADPSTTDGIAVMNFWRSYFTAASASLMRSNYRTTAPSIDGLCP